MRQEYQLVALGLLLTAGGVALLLVPDLRDAGWYVVGAGLLCLGAGAWFVRRGGNVPHPPENLPRLPSPAPKSGGCPKCGSASRPMTGAETTDFYGYDRFVLVRPRVCLSCGHGFETQPSRAGCYLMVAVASLGVLIGLAFIVGGPLLMWSSINDDEPGTLERGKRIVAGLGMIAVGAWWVWRCRKTGYRYWLLKDQA